MRDGWVWVRFFFLSVVVTESVFVLYKPAGWDRVCERLTITVLIKYGAKMPIGPIQWLDGGALLSPVIANINDFSFFL